MLSPFEKSRLSLELKKTASIFHVPVLKIGTAVFISKGRICVISCELDADLVTLPINEGSGSGNGLRYSTAVCVQAEKTNSAKRITLVMKNVPVNYDTKHNSCDKKREILHRWNRLLV